MMPVNPKLILVTHPYPGAEIAFPNAIVVHEQLRAVLEKLFKGSTREVFDADEPFDAGLAAPVRFVRPDEAHEVSDDALPKYMVAVSGGGRQAIVLFYLGADRGEPVLRAVVAASVNEVLAHLIGGKDLGTMRRQQNSYIGTFRAGRRDTPFECLYLDQHALIEGFEYRQGVLLLDQTDSAATVAGPRALEDFYAEASATLMYRERVVHRGGRAEYRVCGGIAEVKAQVSRPLTPEMRRLTPWLLESPVSAFQGQAIDLGLDRPAFIEIATFAREKNRVGHAPQHIAVLKRGDREGVLLLTPMTHAFGGPVYMGSLLSGPEARLELALRTSNRMVGPGETFGRSPFEGGTIFVDPEVASSCKYIAGADDWLSVTMRACDNIDQYLPTIPRWIGSRYATTLQSTAIGHMQIKKLAA